METFVLLVAVIALVIGLVGMGIANRANRRLNELEGRYIRQFEQQPKQS